MEAVVKRKRLQFGILRYIVVCTFFYTVTVCSGGCRAIVQLSCSKTAKKPASVESQRNTHTHPAASCVASYSSALSGAFLTECMLERFWDFRKNISEWSHVYPSVQFFYVENRWRCDLGNAMSGRMSQPIGCEGSRDLAQPISCDLLLDIAFPKSQRHLFST